MTTCNFVCVFIIAACFNVVLTSENTISAEDYEDHNIIGRTVGRSYSLTRCDSKLQVGYQCLSCHRALHCYIGDVAILVDCYGIFRYCRDGRCSRFEGERCAPDNRVTTPSPNSTIHTEVTDNAIGSSKATTSIVTGAATESVAAASEATTNTESAPTTNAKSAPTTNAESMTTNVESEATTKAESVTTNVESEATTKAESVTEAVVIPTDKNAATKNDASRQVL